MLKCILILSLKIKIYKNKISKNNLYLINRFILVFQTLEGRTLNYILLHKF